jgi:hypothetical protein
MKKGYGTWFFLFYLLSCGAWGLMPKKMPNGEGRRFLPNMDTPRDDLILISAGSAALISRNWMQNILLDVMTQRRAKGLTSVGEFVYDDLHIMSAIQELQNDIEYSQKKLSKSWTDVINVVDGDALYFAWKPKSREGINEVLFIVIATVIKKEKGGRESDSDSDSKSVFDYDLVIKSVIQSPFWDEQQIPSIYLKQSLIDQNDYTNQTTLNFDVLYEKSLRYKLAWDTWFCGDGIGTEEKKG